MNEFITVQIVLSLAGCVGIVIATTQLVKKYIKIDPKIIALIISLILGIGRIIIMGNYDAISIFIGLLNIIPILWGSIGGYDTVIKNITCSKEITSKNTNPPTDSSIK